MTYLQRRSNRISLNGLLVMTARSWIARLCPGAVFLCVFGAGAAAAEVAPHRAVYDLSLDTSRSHGEVIDVSGTMLFEWADSCDGWSVTQRTAMSFTYQSGETVDLGWNVVTWESKDGLRYRFFIRNLENGEVKDEYRGEAHLDGRGKGGIADYSLPKKRAVTLPAGVLFPTAHTVELMKRVDAGDKFFWATVFDGFDNDGLSDISAVIATRLKTEASAGSRFPLLAAGPSSRVSLAFYGRNNQGAEPEHEQVLRLHQNGVVEEITLDFGNFSVAGKLKELKALPPPC
jgi:hypothetical protein